jgi:hypothetical protein
LGGILGAAPFASILRRTALQHALVGVQDLGGADAIEQDIGGDAVGYLTAGQQERDRAAEAVGQRVDLGRAPAARTVLGSLYVPFSAGSTRGIESVEEVLLSTEIDRPTRRAPGPCYFPE